MSPILSLLTLSSLFIYVLSHNCGGPEVANSGSNYLELLKDEGSATFNFDARCAVMLEIFVWTSEYVLRI